MAPRRVSLRSVGLYLRVPGMERDRVYLDREPAGGTAQRAAQIALKNRLDDSHSVSYIRCMRSELPVPRRRLVMKVRPASEVLKGLEMRECRDVLSVRIPEEVKAELVRVLGGVPLARFAKHAARAWIEHEKRADGENARWLRILQAGPSNTARAPEE